LWIRGVNEKSAIFSGGYAVVDGERKEFCSRQPFISELSKDKFHIVADTSTLVFAVFTCSINLRYLLSTTSVVL
jgi:hypothetical protein